MSGLELLTAVMEGRRSPSPMAGTVPMTFVEVAPGFIRISARADGRHLNPLGGVHGGFAATVLDSATGCAVHAALGAGEGYGTIDLQVKMLRPVPRDQDLIAEGRAVHLSRSLGTAEGVLKTEDGKLLATATATCFLMRGQSGK
ncbi:hotdog fold thioesterase [Sulfitobacter sp. BDSS02]|nr:hotdog fold thioesterase [Sulfitobacter sp. BDSS02]MBR9851965.1 PaaI family thioesterase [Paracoccaceae bacterium]